MKIYKSIIDNEVFPAIGCTEPISCAYASAVAASYLQEPVGKLVLSVDPGTFKNGASVSIPHTNGAKGNLVAGVLGCFIKRPEKQLEILDCITPKILEQAMSFNHPSRCELHCLKDEKDFRIEVLIKSENHTVLCILARSHTNIEKIVRDGEILFQEPEKDSNSSPLAYRQILKTSRVETLLSLAETLGEEEYDFLQNGIDMNLALAERGGQMKLFAYGLRTMNQKGFISEDLFYKVKVCVAAAVDARMNGVELPTMTSGGSGNQGIVAILAPYIVGNELKISKEKILKSIAITHIVNAYTKCFLGELSVNCGCAMSAGLAAATAIVYQQAGIDLPKITLAINNVIGDLSGLICDGAKPGCALKATSSVDSALRGAFMALDNYGIDYQDGLLGKTIEESIQNLKKLALEGMCGVDPALLAIISSKQ